jgi:hypothetical protein
MTKKKIEEITPVAPKRPALVTKENLRLIAPGLFLYLDAGDLSECHDPASFKCQQSKNYGVRPGDVIICKNLQQAILVVVK